MTSANGFWAGLVLGALAAGCSAEQQAGSEASNELEPAAVQSVDALTSTGLSNRQASTVLQLIDDICGDSWCEGDHDFHFDQIQCQKPCARTGVGSCQLRFRIFPYDSDLATGPTYARTCKTPGFTGFGSLVDTAESGYQSLNWDYYDALSACISEVESKLPPI